MYSITDENGTQKFSDLEDAKAYAHSVHFRTGIILGIMKED